MRAADSDREVVPTLIVNDAWRPTGRQMIMRRQTANTLESPYSDHVDTSILAGDGLVM